MRAAFKNFKKAGALALGLLFLQGCAGLRPSPPYMPPVGPVLTQPQEVAAGIPVLKMDPIAHMQGYVTRERLEETEAAPLRAELTPNSNGEFSADVPVWHVRIFKTPGDVSPENLKAEYFMIYSRDGRVTRQKIIDYTEPAS